MYKNMKEMTTATLDTLSELLPSAEFEISDLTFRYSMVGLFVEYRGVTMHVGIESVAHGSEEWNEALDPDVVGKGVADFYYRNPEVPFYEGEEFDLEFVASFSVNRWEMAFETLEEAIAALKVELARFKESVTPFLIGD